MRRAFAVGIIAALLGAALLWLHRHHIGSEAAFEADYAAAARDAGAP